MKANQLTEKRIKEILAVLPSFVGHQPHSNRDPDSLRQLLADYFRLVEVAYCIRRGGVKAMLYRLETGKTELVLDSVDYIHEAHARLTNAYGQLYSSAEANNPTMLARLNDISAEEEECVRLVLADLDNIVLQDRRKEVVLSELHLESR